MIDLITRALLHPIDYAGVLKVRGLRFKEIIEEAPGTYSFTFESRETFSWQAGQHALFTLPDKNITGKKWRAFSVASSPHERLVRIATRIPPEPSDFKKKLMSLVPGETIRMFGPFGEFHANYKVQQIIGVAGGIGITPFRALAYEIAHNHLPETKLTLIYSAKADYPFQRELDNWSNENQNLEIIYVDGPNAVNQELENQFDLHGNRADYYLSGAPGMIKALRTQCQKLTIKKMVNDPFKGY